MPFDSFYQGRRVLVTGDTGFKGSWLASWLTELGAEVFGLGLPPATDPSLFDILRLGERIRHTDLDLREPEAVRAHIGEVRPDVVFHLAAQAIVRLSYRIPVDTLATNFMGTAHLLDAIRRADYTPDQACSVVVVTSDKCYDNRETCYAYREYDPVGGHDIYSMSKGAAELLASSWRRSFFAPPEGQAPAVRLATCRAGNVIGGGDWAADRIVVDCMAALTQGQPITIRNPLSIRPWQHVLEPLSGYLQLGAAMATQPDQAAHLCSAWNFGPGRESQCTVGTLCDAIVRHWGNSSWSHAAESDPVHEARFLKLAIDKASHYLGWAPVWGFDTTVEHTVGWYRLAHESGYDTATMQRHTYEQIRQYVADASQRTVRWTTGL